MDVKKLVEQVETRIDFNKSRAILREKIQADLHFGFNGGMFKATPELLAFANYGLTFPDHKFVVEDTNGNPILVEDVNAFITVITERLSSVMNRWYVEYEKLKKTRKI